jgi:hypothetical protein
VVKHTFQVGTYKLVLEKHRECGIDGYLFKIDEYYCENFFNGSLAAVFKMAIWISLQKGKISFEDWARVFGFSPEEILVIIQQEKNSGSKVVFRSGQHYIVPIRIMED